jgi:hypothetical protein
MKLYNFVVPAITITYGGLIKLELTSTMLARTSCHQFKEQNIGGKIDATTFNIMAFSITTLSIPSVTMLSFEVF